MIYPFRYSTGIHCTGKAVEWVVLRKNRKGTVEKIREGSIPVPESFFARDDAPAFPAELLPEIRHEFCGTITVALSSGQLLLHVLDLPSTDDAELQSMVDLQIDSISPFPVDQLTVSFEVFHQTEESSRILAVAAPRKTVDELGELFKAHHVYIKSVDAEMLSWWSLAADIRPHSGRALMILIEHTEFFLVITDDGVPVCVRPLALFRNLADEEIQNELVEEFAYSLLFIETKYGSRPLDQILFRHEGELPAPLLKKMEARLGVPVQAQPLSDLTPLAEGIARRALDKETHHVELVPQEWLDLQRKRKMQRIGAVVTAAVLGLWLGIIAIAGIIFSIRNAGFRRIENEAEQYAGPALRAQAARAEMLSLEKFADRSHSALECLREITVILPAGVELASFTYKKGEAVSLRGASDNTEPVYDFFQNLGKSELFTGVKDQPVSTRLVKDRRVSTFSITADLPPAAGITGEQP
ncbi:MAG: PilN domain-containing protein [Kiritimatiellales bacterium]